VPHPPAKGRGGERPGNHRGGSVVYVLPEVLVVGAATGPEPGHDSATVERAPAPHVPTGTLVLDARPIVPTQIFVDGYFVGSSDQIGSSIDMPAGPHDVALKADGYEPVHFGVQIREGQALTYRETLKATDATPAPEPAAPAPPVTLYVIAGCYAGSTPPDASALPARCDIAQLKTITTR
jgi:hypothetical protein